MKTYLWFLAAGIFGSIFGLIVGSVINYYVIPDPPAATMPPAAVTVDASDSLTYRPIRALGDDWYLVEVAYPHVCDNPFPIGKAKMVMVVPHLVRMHASELDKLDNPEK